MKAADVYGGERPTLAAYFRKRRFKVVNSIIETIIAKRGSCRILDVGGTELYWRINQSFLDRYSGKITITTANIGDPSDVQEGNSLFKHEVGDATDSQLFERDLDLIHSNSVIEHVGGWSSIRAMADNIVAAGKPYYVQTPNFWFPVEPHFRTVGFQWLPTSTRGEMLLKRPRGFRAPSNYDEAMESVSTIHLLTFAEMKRLFSNAEIMRERVGPLTKSLMAVYRG